MAAYILCDEKGLAELPDSPSYAGGVRVACRGRLACGRQFTSCL
jgi:hypothetical protein